MVFLLRLCAKGTGNPGYCILTLVPAITDCLQSGTEAGGYRSKNGGKERRGGGNGEQNCQAPEDEGIWNSTQKMSKHQKKKVNSLCVICFVPLQGRICEHCQPIKSFKMADRTFCQPFDIFRTMVYSCLYVKTHDSLLDY